jgi:hypothetical protein
VISAEGVNTIYFNSTDKAGNVETVKSTAVRLAYSVTFSMSGLPEGCSWSVTLGTTTISCTSKTATLRVIQGEYNWNISARITGPDGYQYSASLTNGTLSVPLQLSQSISYSVQGMVGFEWMLIAVGIPSIIFSVIGMSEIIKRRKARRDKTSTIDENIS